MIEEKNNFYIHTDKYRLFPTPEQESVLNQWMAACRMVYNAALEQRKIYGGRIDGNGNKINFNSFSQNKEIHFRDKNGCIGLMNDPELKWISDTSRDCFSFVLRELDEAFNEFFKGGGYPRFKTPDRGNALTFRCWNISGSGKVSYVNEKGEERKSTIISVFGQDSVKIPKIGRIKYHRHKKYHGELRNCKIVKEDDKWFICLSTKRVAPELKNRGYEIGIDVGIKKPMALSNGEFPMTSDILDCEIETQEKMIGAQKKLSKAKKGSKRRIKAKKRLASLCRKRARQRVCRNHKITTSLSKGNRLIAVENLKIKNMTKSAKGTEDNPGKNVKAKSGLNREMLNIAPGQIFSQLEYKSKKFGSKLVRVNPKYTSQRCNSCGYIEGENRDKEKFICKSCGHEDHADTNAARNILFLANSEAVASLRKRQVDVIGHSATHKTPIVSRKLPGLTTITSNLQEDTQTSGAFTGKL